MIAYAFRTALLSMKRSKVLTTLMIVSLAVGIGACMTTLTVVRALSGDPLPGKSQEIFYAQIDVNPLSKGQEPFDVLDYRTAHDLWSAKVAQQQTMVASNTVKISSEASGSRPLMKEMLSTTADFFPMFNVPFLYGRAWNDEDDERRSRVAVISSDLNRQIFNGENSVGRFIRVNNESLEIVGVLERWRPSPAFYKIRGGRFSAGNTNGFYSRPDDVYVPFGTSLDVNPRGFQHFTCWATPEIPGRIEDEPCVSVGLWVYLASPERRQEFEQFMDNYSSEQKSIGRIEYANNNRLRSLTQWLDFNSVVPSDVKIQSVIALAFLIICIANAIGLLLAKFLKNSNEIGIRRALGATRADIVMQCLAEAVVVGVGGGIGGLILALVGVWLVRLQKLTYSDLVYVDVPMFVGTFVLAMFASLLAAAYPSVRASMVQPAVQIRLS